MKVLFVSSGNSEGGISSIVRNQSLALLKIGIDIKNYTIKGKGLLGYLRNIPHIRKIILSNQIDVIHAHYSLSAFTTVLAMTKTPIVVSLMGSDTQMSAFYRIITKVCAKYFWAKVILKSERMNAKLSLEEFEVQPNGVDLEIFFPDDKIRCCKEVGFNHQEINVTFIANPKRYEKNYPLCEKAVQIASRNCNFKFHLIHKVGHDLIPIYLNATDILILTSRWEGSPNIVKEAMACNTSIVSTNVGDVNLLFGNEPGYHISNHDEIDLSLKLQEAIRELPADRRTNGRQRIIALGLDSNLVAQNIKALYKSVMNN